MMTDRQQKAAGTFYTDAELAAVPSRRRAIQAPGTPRRDPNDAPVSAAARAAWAALRVVCAYCYEPGDARSQLGADAMHPECSAAWAAELAERKGNRR